MDNMNKNINLIIDGIPMTGTEGQSILQVAMANGIDIPHMCYDERIEPCTTCGMCVCEVEGRNVLVHSCEEKIAEGMVVHTDTEKVKASRVFRLKKMLAKHEGDCKAPCMLACPAKTDCQGYVNLIRRGDFETAIKLIKEKLPLAASLGRVCPHPCEDKCRRAIVDEAISIQWLKRFVADIDLFSKNPYMPPVAPETGKSIGIIGGGPAGLSAAYFLRQRGHAITIYDSMPKAGGMLRYGIPEYRLPKRVLDREISLIEKMGVEIVPNTKIGTDISFEDFRKKHDASIICIGAWTSTGVGCEGEKQAGVIGGIDFLCRVAQGEDANIGERVAIVGGGNTAMDACRTSVRVGASEVYNIYRRTIREMPADKAEIIEGREEGVVFKNLCNPIKIVRNKKGALDVTLQIMKQGEPDASGRRSPVPVEGETELIEVDTVILATGQAVADFPVEELEKTRRKAIMYDKENYMTSIEGVFAAGDCGNDKISIAVEAMADAFKVSESVDHYLDGDKVEFHAPILLETSDARYLAFESREKMFREKMEHMSPEARKNNFKEIVYGYTPETAMADAARCLECGCHDYHECKLIKYSQELGVKKEVPNPDRHPETATDKFIKRDANKCINCGHCVNVCQNLMGIGAQGKLVKNAEGKIVPEFAGNLRDRGCVGCGLCVSVCPTGALEGNEAGKLAYWVTEKTKTTCTYCGVGCQLNFVTKWGKILGVQPVYGTANEGQCCVKGKFSHNFIQHKDRLKYPMIRRDGVLERATWEEAYEVIVEKMRECKMHYGADSVVGFSSAKVTNEENYLFQKMMRAAIGTNNVDHCARLCHASTVAGLANTLGSGAMTNPLADVKNAEVIFVTGSNTTEAHPVMGAYIRQAHMAGAKLIVADPKRIPLAEEADLFLQIKPGTSVALSNTMLNVIFAEGLEDKEYIEAHTTGVEALKEMVAKYTPEYGAKIIGVPAEDIIKATRMYAGTKRAYTAYSMGITQHLNGTDNVSSISNLALATGNLGHAGTGINPLRGQSNVQGACDMGALPTDYPAYQKVANPEVQAKFEKLWGTKLSSKVGHTVTTTCDAILKGDVKMLYVMGENPMVSDPDVHHVKKALNKAFLVVQDIFLTETAELADVVLPATSFAEKEGTFTNTERRVQRVRPAVAPIGESKPDWMIISEIMDRLGTEANYTCAEDIFNEMRLASPAYAGMTYERIDADGLCWPCPNTEHPGTPILHSNGPVIGKGVFKAMEWLPSPETSLEDYPLVLMTGRVLEHYHTRTMTKRNDKINELYPENFIQLNPLDAQEYGIFNGEEIKISSLRGSVIAKVRFSDVVARGTAFMPFHFANGANILSDASKLDPVAKIPGFKQIGIQIEKI